MESTTSVHWLENIRKLLENYAHATHAENERIFCTLQILARGCKKYQNLELLESQTSNEASLGFLEELETEPQGSQKGNSE